MRKRISSFGLAFIIFLGGFQMSYAQLTCTNCATWMQDLIKYALMTKDYAADLVSSNANIITATQQTLATVNSNVLIPLRDALTLMMIMQSGNQIQNLILGSLGNKALLITNPEQYLANVQNNAVRGILSQVPQNSIYGNSILNSVVNKYKNNTTASKINALSQSSIPSTVQKNACSEEALTRLAEQDVANANDGAIEIDAYNKRRSEIFDSLCKGDPTKDSTLAQRLNNINIQRPDIGGWDALLANVSGDNIYTRAQLAQIAVNEQITKVVQTKKEELAIGGGIKSETSCDQFASNDGSGDTTLPSESDIQLNDSTDLPSETENSTTFSNPLPCLRESITKSAGSLKTLYEESIVSPLRTLQASFGTGAGSLVSTAFTTVSLLNSISSIINTGTPTRSGTTGVYGSINSYGTVATIASSTPVRDLANNPQGKANLLSPIERNLTSHLNALSDLQTTEQNYLGEINGYASQLETLKSCYDGLVRDYPNISGNASITSFNAYYSSKKSATDSLRTSISTEMSKINVTRELINNTLSQVRASNSSQEISTIFSVYQNRVDRENLPTAVSAPARQGDYILYKSTVSDDLGPNGNIPVFRSSCDQIRAQEEERIRQEGIRNNTNNTSSRSGD
ncbi:MAG: hypothetical protein JWN37_158 [Candidatus Nomurabacteria bacterium]|nr:hypothetical protein [Candidatus Nomurabacteria bacterium]